MESINPVDNPVAMPPNGTKAQDGQPERREDPKYAVGGVVGRVWWWSVGWLVVRCSRLGLTRGDAT